MKRNVYVMLLVATAVVANAAPLSTNLDEELSAVQKEYLSAIFPHPDVSNLPASTSAELFRRTDIVRKTWPDRLRAITDAKTDVEHGNLRLRGFGPLNSLEQEYTTLIKDKYGIGFQVSLTPVTNIHEWIYIHAFNSMMVDAIEQKLGRFTIGACLGDAARRIGVRKFAGDYYFVPYRFAFTPCSIHPLINLSAVSRLSDDDYSFLNDREYGKRDYSVANWQKKFRARESAQRRGAYFNSLATALQKQEKGRLTKERILEVLGPPDVEHLGDKTEVLLYKFADYDDDSNTLIVMMTNGAVVSFGKNFMSDDQIAAMKESCPARRTEE